MSYVPGKLIVHADAAATANANNIAIQRRSFVSALRANSSASLMVILIVISIPIAFVNEIG
jgi:hypothetical protein